MNRLGIVRGPAAAMGLDVGIPSPETAKARPGQTRHKPRHVPACRRLDAYDRCATRDCEAKSRSVPRATVETGFAEILQRLQPATGLFQLAEAMPGDAWTSRLAIAKNEKDALQEPLGVAGRQIESLPDRIVEANSASEVNAHEARIDRLERETFVLSARVERTVRA